MTAEEAPECSRKRGERTDISNISSSGFLHLKGDPGPWIEKNYDSRMSVRVLKLELLDEVETIVDSIGELSELTHLYIHGGKTLKYLPITITKLHNLQELYLRNCIGLDDLPISFDQLVNLKYLLLQGCCIEWLPNSLGKLPNLEILEINECFYLKCLPPYLKARELKLRGSTIRSLPAGGLCNLETIHIEHCFFAEDLLTSLLGLEKLWGLCIRNCDITFLPECITKLSSLEVLELRKCFSLEKLPASLNKLINLRILCITYGNIKMLPSIAKLKHLNTFCLKNCSNLEELPADLDRLISLSDLDISGTSIKSIPHSITNLFSLTHLRLPSCFKPETLPNDLNVSVMVDYEELDDECTSISEDSGIIVPSSAQEVNELSLDDTNQGINNEWASAQGLLNLNDQGIDRPKLKRGLEEIEIREEPSCRKGKQ